MRKKSLNWIEGHKHGGIKSEDEGVPKIKHHLQGPLPLRMCFCELVILVFGKVSMTKTSKLFLLWTIIWLCFVICPKSN